MAEVLSVEGVCKGYSRGGQWTGVLEDVSFEVGPGEVVAIIGDALTGKTTLLRIAAGMERPDRGESVSGQPGAGWAAGPVANPAAWAMRSCGSTATGRGLKVEVSKFVGWPLALHGRGRKQAEQLAARALERVGARECVGRRWGELSELAASAGRSRAGVRGQPAGGDHRRSARRPRQPWHGGGIRSAALTRGGVRASLRGADERLGHGIGDVRRPGVLAHAQGRR